MAATAFLVGVALLVITVLFVFVLPLLRGADQASRSQNAADAAAIAGGKQVRELVLNRLAAGDLSVLSGPWGSAGSSDASIYAGRNDATLIRYSFDAVRDEVRAEIRFNKVPADGVARAERSAAVELGVALGRCTVSRDEIEPEPEPSPTESDDDEDEEPVPPPPPPPPVFEFGLDCPGGVLLTGYDDEAELARAAHSRLRNLLEVRLVQ